MGGFLLFHIRWRHVLKDFLYRARERGLRLRIRRTYVGGRGGSIGFIRRCDILDIGGLEVRIRPDEIRKVARRRVIRKTLRVEIEKVGSRSLPQWKLTLNYLNIRVRIPSPIRPYCSISRDGDH